MKPYVFKPLEGERVRLVPLESKHALPLFDSAKDPAIWTNYPIRIETLEQMDGFIDKAMQGRDRGEQYPFAVWDKERNEFVGSTRFLRISEENDNLNIGSTWYSPRVWRTSVNTEAKFLMLQYAFEILGVSRVEIITTTDNVVSQRAIERLGAIKEGVLRKKYHNLDYVIYSIIDSDWSGVKERLQGFLNSKKGTDI